MKRFEGCSLVPYLCPGDVWTIGYGHALTLDGEQLRGRLREGDARSVYPSAISEVDAEALLIADLEDAAQGVLRVVTVPLTDGQFGALVSFVYNLGLAQLRRSTLLRLVNAGDFEHAAEEFKRWIYSNGKLLEGLVRRRKAERDLFVS